MSEVFGIWNNTDELASYLVEITEICLSTKDEITGKGSRLYPLTKMRAKPAVPLAGKYRLIDIPISNCINSGIEKMYVLTQFNSASLNRHIGRTYNLNGPFGQGFVEVLAAQQTPDSPKWFEGTADACLLYTSPSPRDTVTSRMPSSA